MQQIKERTEELREEQRQKFKSGKYNNYEEWEYSINKEYNFPMIRDDEDYEEQRRYWKNARPNDISSSRGIFWVDGLVEQDTLRKIKPESLFVEKKKYDGTYKYVWKYNGEPCHFDHIRGHWKCPICGIEKRVQFNPSRKTTCVLCQHCLKSIYYSSDLYQDDFVQTMQQRYGVSRPIQAPEIKGRIANTMIMRYGVPYSGLSKELLQKTRDTTKLRYGRENFFSGLHSWELWGDGHIGMSSKVERKFVQWLQNTFPKTTMELFCMSTGHVFICTAPNTGKIIHYYPDVYIPSKKLIIEFYGDYWHANPQIYTSEDDSRFVFSLVHEIRERDAYRKNALEKEHGVKFQIVWENDWKHHRAETEEQIKQWLVS